MQCAHTFGLLLGTEAPVMTPNGADFLFFSAVCTFPGGSVP